MSGASSSSPSPSPTGAPGGGNANGSPNGGQSSSLYLFTFLATLLLLLAVSCAIVIRSFILRRRFRRRIEEAIAAGVLFPAMDDGPGGGMGRGRRRDFGEKPKLWEVWVDENGHIYESSSKDNSSDENHLGKGEGKWEEILPVSATILTSNASKPTSVSGNGNNSSSPSLSTLPTRTLFSRIFARNPSPPPTPSALEEQQPSATELNVYPSSLASKEQVDEERLQVSVLISMPNPNARRSHNRDSVDGSLKGKGRGPGFEDAEGEGEIPDVVFGVAEVGLRP